MLTYLTIEYFNLGYEPVSTNCKPSSLGHSITCLNPLLAIWHYDIKALDLERSAVTQVWCSVSYHVHYWLPAYSAAVTALMVTNQVLQVSLYKSSSCSDIPFTPERGADAFMTETYSWDIYWLPLGGRQHQSSCNKLSLVILHIQC